jgi:hypothetical protein
LCLSEYIEGFFGESDMDEVELIDDKEEANA